MSKKKKKKSKSFLRNIRNGLRLRSRSAQKPKRIKDNFQDVDAYDARSGSAPDEPAPEPQIVLGKRRKRQVFMRRVVKPTKEQVTKDRNAKDEMLDLMKMMMMMEGGKKNTDDPNKSTDITEPPKKKKKKILPVNEMGENQRLLQEMKVRRKQILNHETKQLKKKWTEIESHQKTVENTSKTKQRNARSDQVVPDRGKKLKPIFSTEQTNSLAWKVENVKGMLDQLRDKDAQFVSEIERKLREKLFPKSTKKPSEIAVAAAAKVSSNQENANKDEKETVKKSEEEIDPNDPWA